MSGGTLTNIILAYNAGLELTVSGDIPAVTYSTLYDRSGRIHNLLDLESTNQVVDPGFLAYDKDGYLTDLHLSTSSALINAGSPLIIDPDGSPSDIGLYGGVAADGFDLDGDGYPDYFWPGTIYDVPEGFDPVEFDCDDLDQTTHECVGP